MTKDNDSNNIYLESIFENCDRNHDGSLDTQELYLLLKDNCEKTAVEAIVQNSDINQDKKLDYNEFVWAVIQFKKAFEKVIDNYVEIYNIDGKVKARRKPSEAYEDHGGFRKTTFLTIFLSIIQVTLFCTKHLWEIDQWLVFRHDKRFEAWRYFTYIFSHNTVVHLCGNIALQLAIGLPLEIRERFRIIPVYLAGTCAGPLFQFTFYPNDDLAGVSPAVCALISAHLSKLILNFYEVTNALVEVYLILVLLGFDAILNLFLQENSGEVSYISHLGGAICGCLVGLMVLRNLKVDFHEKVVKIAAVFIYFGTMTYFIYRNI